MDDDDDRVIYELDSISQGYSAVDVAQPPWQGVRSSIGHHALFEKLHNQEPAGRRAYAEGSTGGIIARDAQSSKADSDQVAALALAQNLLLSDALPRMASQHLHEQQQQQQQQVEQLREVGQLHDQRQQNQLEQSHMQQQQLQQQQLQQQQLQQQQLQQQQQQQQQLLQLQQQQQQLLQLQQQQQLLHQQLPPQSSAPAPPPKRPRASLAAAGAEGAALKASRRPPGPQPAPLPIPVPLLPSSLDSDGGGWASAAALVPGPPLGGAKGRLRKEGAPAAAGGVTIPGHWGPTEKTRTAAVKPAVSNLLNKGVRNFLSGATSTAELVSRPSFAAPPAQSLQTKAAPAPFRGAPQKIAPSCSNAAPIAASPSGKLHLFPASTEGGSSSSSAFSSSSHAPAAPSVFNQCPRSSAPSSPSNPPSVLLIARSAMPYAAGTAHTEASDIPHFLRGGAAGKGASGMTDLAGEEGSEEEEGGEGGGRRSVKLVRGVFRSPSTRAASRQQGKVASFSASSLALPGGSGSAAGSTEPTVPSLLSLYLSFRRRTSHEASLFANFPLTLASSSSSSSAAAATVSMQGASSAPAGASSASINPRQGPFVDFSLKKQVELVGGVGGLAVFQGALAHQAAGAAAALPPSLAPFCESLSQGVFVAFQASKTSLICGHFAGRPHLPLLVRVYQPPVPILVGGHEGGTRLVPVALQELQEEGVVGASHPKALLYALLWECLA